MGKWYTINYKGHSILYELYALIKLLYRSINKKVFLREIIMKNIDIGQYLLSIYVHLNGRKISLPQR